MVTEGVGPDSRGVTTPSMTGEELVDDVVHGRRLGPRQVDAEVRGRAFEVLSVAGEQIEMRELDEDVFQAAEALGIDISRPERGSDEEDERRRERSY